MQCHPYRSWKRPAAQKRYERDRMVAEKNHLNQVEKVGEILADTIGKYKTIVARGEHNLLLTLANIIGFRLYDEESDAQRTGASKYRQGERQQIMSDALKLVIERNIAELHTNHDSGRLQLRIARRPVPVRQSPKWTLVIDGKEIHNYIPKDDELVNWGFFDDDASDATEVILSDRLTSMLRKVNEPIFS